MKTRKKVATTAAAANVVVFNSNNSNKSDSSSVTWKPIISLLIEVPLFFVVAVVEFYQHSYVYRRAYL